MTDDTNTSIPPAINLDDSDLPAYGVNVFEHPFASWNHHECVTLQAMVDKINAKRGNSAPLMKKMRKYANVLGSYNMERQLKATSCLTDSREAWATKSRVDKLKRDIEEYERKLADAREELALKEPLLEQQRAEHRAKQMAVNPTRLNDVRLLRDDAIQTGIDILDEIHERELQTHLSRLS